MDIIPAIDLKEGKVIRLYQGKFDDVTEYGNSPVQTAQMWESKGARILHLVDLDGAQHGHIKQLDVIYEITKTVNVPVQVGGGIRSMDDIDALLHHGIERVILGTRAVEDKDFLEHIVRQWGDKIVVSIDCRDGYVTQRGWTQQSNIRGVDLAKDLQDMGVKTIVYTDIARDGTLQGPNMDALKQLLEAVDIPVIASGGISSLEDVKQLKALEPDGICGAITGKALYEGTLKLEDAINVCYANE